MIKNLFLLPLESVFSLMGRLQGAASMVKYAKSNDIKLPLSEKTLRKAYKEPGSISNLSRAKLQQLVSSISPTLINALPSEDDFLKQPAVLFSSVQWRSALIGLRIFEGESYFPDTLAYIDHLIDLEVELFQKIVAEKCMTTRFVLMVESTLSQCISEEVSEHKKLLLKIAQEIEGSEVSSALESHPYSKIYMGFSMISILMRVMAYAEHEWSRSFGYDVYELANGSYISKLLPCIDEEGKVINPLRKLFIQWRRAYGFESWDCMAVSLPGDACIEDKKRKLLGWVKGEHIPESSIILEWLSTLMPSADTGNQRYMKFSMFKVAVFLQNTFSEFKKDVFIQEPDMLYRAFNSFNRHFSELIVDAPVDVRAPVKV